MNFNNCFVMICLLNYLCLLKLVRKSLDVLDVFNNKSESRKFSFLVEKSYNKPIIDFNFGRHEDLSTLKSDIHLGLAASVNYHFFG